MKLTKVIYDRIMRLDAEIDMLEETVNFDIRNPPKQAVRKLKELQKTKERLKNEIERIRREQNDSNQSDQGD